MEENIRYLIGIDFGDGETTASYIDLNEPQKPKSLHIRDGQNPEQDKIESCICKDMDGNWTFVRGIQDYSSPDLRIGFKQSMDVITDENKEAFGAFIRLVFDKILNLQLFLHYNPQTGERNFKLCVACPSGWNDSTNNQIHEYLKFMQHFIPASWVIKESDAAYFKFNKPDFAGNSVLVIDIGSSTIDFTYYDPQTGRAEDPIGYPHGASRVERSILDYLINNDKTFQEGQKMITEALATTGTGNRNWMMSVRHFIKAQKEDFYTRELAIMMLSAPIRAFYSSIPSGTLLDVDFEKAELEGTVIKEYVDQLRTDFEAVSNSISPQIVILTGGASRMPWLCHMVEDVFCQKNPNVVVHKDEEPSYVVSHGIVAYALARTTFEREFEKWLKEFWEKYTKEKLAELVHEHFNEVMRAIQLPMIKEFMGQWLEGNIRDAAGNRSTQALKPYFTAHNESVMGQNNAEIKAKVNQMLQDKFKEEFYGVIQDLFIKCYKGHNPNVPFVLDVAVNFGGSTINSDFDLKQIDERTKSIYADFFNKGRLDKDRDPKSKRQEFYDMMMTIQESATLTVPQADIDNAVNNIINSLNAYFTEVKKHAPFVIYE